MTSRTYPEEGEPFPVVHVGAWAAFIQETAESEPERLGACASEADIPPSFRRRLGPYGRMAVSCGIGVSDGNSDIVFCSRYGDVNVAYRLLQNLTEHTPLSPAGFSMSVHNGVPGAMDLVQKNRVGHTAIAAGAESLSAGICEAWARLNEAPQQPVTLLYADYALPPAFKEFETGKAEGIAFALSLSMAEVSDPVGYLRPAGGGETATTAPDPSSETLAHALIAMLRAGAPERHIWETQGLRWAFGIGSDATD